ncbi:twitching motility protein PilT [Laspinema sp. C3]|uniref:Twitching motility protein PilT n=1 Tax=Laspinema olomoucense D3b TaxID=2953688 RepID=A0ABT2NF72_9CYAN|nr:twitching motility protein PilT [Laspinema sp. D3b]MCT7981352.1 twitching motility protein PilT [Laspinema sp. D3b]
MSDYLAQVIQDKTIILPYCHAAAEWFAAERARLTALGRMPSYPDGQIAAIAKVNNLILVTRNISDYADFDGLTIENWFV